MEDYVAALDFIRGPDLSGVVDSSRVALWGTSFSGGHVLNVAAADNVPSTVGGIRAIVAQVKRILVLYHRGVVALQSGKVLEGAVGYASPVCLVLNKMLLNVVLHRNSNHPSTGG